MSATITNHSLAHSGFTGFTTRLVATIIAWNDARQTRNELARLTDRELDDIGLTRADIDRVARA